MTALKKLREAAGLTRREVSEQSGINLRSLQDYEQGHKSIARANGELLFKLSLVLGCTLEDLLTPYLAGDLHGSDSFFQENAGKEWIENRSFRSEQYHLSGRWFVTEKETSIIFVCRGSVVRLPLPVWVTEKTLPWLSEAAVMRMERYVKDLTFKEKSDQPAETGEWDDWG